MAKRRTRLTEGKHQVYILFVKNKRFYIQIAKMECQNNFKAFLFENTKNFYFSASKQRTGKNEIDFRLRYIIDYTCYGATGLCIDWIKNDMDELPEEMTSKIIDCIHPEMKKYFI